jgi:hypothetical protein
MLFSLFFVDGVRGAAFARLLVSYKTLAGRAARRLPTLSVVDIRSLVDNSGAFQPLHRVEQR